MSNRVGEACICEAGQHYYARQRRRRVALHVRSIWLLGGRAFLCGRLQAWRLAPRGTGTPQFVRLCRGVATNSLLVSTGPASVT